MDIEEGWTNFKTALQQAQPFLGYLPKGWHREGCDRDDQSPKVSKLGKWLYLELRPYPTLRNDFFPSLSDSIPLLSDDSLCGEGLYVDSLVCSNLSVGEGRHYWLVEVSGGRIQHAYDSVQGVQSLTQEVYRMLQVTGVLLKAASCGKPSLRNPKLDQMAGKVETVHRRSLLRRVAKLTSQVEPKAARGAKPAPKIPAKYCLAGLTGGKISSALQVLPQTLTAGARTRHIMVMLCLVR